MAVTVADLQTKLANEIPVTTHLGVTVRRYDETGLTLAAPLAQNRNHEGTGFAGSVATLATLAGWGLVWLGLRELDVDCQVVIQNGAIDYLRPVTGDFSARATLPNAQALLRLREVLARHGRGRVAVSVEVCVGEETVAAFRGRYVALRRGRGETGPRGR